MSRVMSLASVRRTGAQLRSLWTNTIDGHVIALTWAPDGSRLAAASIEGPIGLFAGGDGAATMLSGHTFGTSALDWNGDGSLLASAGQDGQVKVWDATTATEQWVRAGGSSWVERVAWCPMAPLLASAAGKRLTLWNPDGSEARVFPDHPSTIADIAWRPNTREITTAHYGGLTLWSPDAAEPLVRHEWQGSTLVISWSPDQRYIATGDQDSTVHFWIAKTGNDLQMYGYPTKVRELAWDRDSRYLATGGGDQIVVWDCSGRGPRGSKPIMLAGHDANVAALEFQRTGPLLASGGQDGRVFVWRPGRDSQSLSDVELDDQATQVRWSPQGDLLAVGAADGTVSVYAVGT